MARDLAPCPRSRLLATTASVGLAVLAIVAPLAVRAEPAVSILPLPFAVEEMRGPDSHLARALPSLDGLRQQKGDGAARFVAVWGKGGAAALFVRDGQVRSFALDRAAMEASASGGAARTAIPQSRLQSAGPLTVTLSEPTAEYRHGVLGDAVEAASVTITERQPVRPNPLPQPVPVKTVRVPAGPGAVFEDLEPRLADLDRDGTPEIMVVRSSLEKGSSLAVIGKREGAWSILAETPPIGQPHRWLNPAASADFDGDGRIDVALVKTPHLDGVLQVWTWEAGALALQHELAGYANHALGSTALDLAAVVDLDGDGVPELAIPALDRAALALLSLKGGIREIARIPLPARVERGVAALGTGKDTHLVAGLEDGRVAIVRP